MTASRATLYVTLGACGFGAISIFVAIATNAGASLLNVLYWRYVIAALVLLLVMVRGGGRPDRRGFRVMMTAGLVQSLIAVLSLSALRYISAATLAFLFYTYPAFVAVLARIRHSEPLTPARLTALMVSLVGIFLMIGAPGGAALHPTGVFLAIISAVMYALYIPMINGMQRELTPLATALYMTTGAAVFLGFAGLARAELTIGLPMTAWWSVLALALLCTAGAFLVFLRGLGVLGPVRTAIVSTIEPFFTATLGALFLKQPMTTSTIAGGGLIAAAVVLLQRKSNDAPIDSRPKTQDPRPQ
ncbi:MAG: DMT family transporter [Gemmatimonadota bacterium]